MYQNCSAECLKNAESLLEDAKILLDRKKYASAQSLSVTALEEVGKAIILELVDLNYYDKDLAKKSIYNHKPKRAILKAIEKGKVLIDQINRSPGAPSITKEKMKQLGEELLTELNSLESNRVNGLYLEIDFDKGKIKSSPRDCNESDAIASIEEADKYVELGKILCNILREIQKCDGTINNLRLILETDNYDNFWKDDNNTRKPDKTLTISYDES